MFDYTRRERLLKMRESANRYEHILKGDLLKCTIISSIYLYQ